MGRRRNTPKGGNFLGSNPLEGEQLLLDALYGQKSAGPLPPPPVESIPPPSPPAPPPVFDASPPLPAEAPAQENPKPKPDHYKVVSISLYKEDIERLEQMVRELKRRGHHKANKSQLIRQALAQVDLDRVGNLS